MKKPKKKLIIGIGAAAVVIGGGIAVFGNAGKQADVIPKVEVVQAVTGDVQQTVEASGTVVSEEEKTYFSPANARVDTVSFEEGQTVKAGTRLVEFNVKDLEREQKKAELNLKSGKLDMENTLNKSDKGIAETTGRKPEELCGKLESTAFSGDSRCLEKGCSRGTETG